MTRNGSCRTSSASFANYDPDTSSWKTFQDSLFTGPEKFSETWPRSGTMRSGIASRLRPSVPYISEIGSFYLPTMVADDTGHRTKPYSQGGRALSYMLGGPVNPMWGEWFMGFPIGHTDLEPSATPSSRKLPSTLADAS